MQKVCPEALAWSAKNLQAPLAPREGCKKFASVPDTQGRLQKICKRRWHSGKAAKNLQAPLASREGCKKFASVAGTQGRLQKICKRRWHPGKVAKNLQGDFSVFLSGEVRKALLNLTARAEANRGANISAIFCYKLEFPTNQP